MTDEARPDGGRRAWAPVLLVVAAGALAIAIAWSARAAEGRAALVEAEAALSRADVDAAITAARIAASSRCPTCDAPAHGFAVLERIAREAEARGDDANAFAAYAAMRTAALATATLGGGPRRDQAEAELARIGHKIDATSALGGGAPSAAATEERLRATLGAGGVPSGATFGLVGAGAIAFALGAFRLARASALRIPDAALALAGIAVAGVALALF